MAFDLIEFLANFLRVRESIVYMALFELVMLRKKSVVIGERFDYCGE